MKIRFPGINTLHIFFLAKLLITRILSLTLYYLILSIADAFPLRFKTLRVLPIDLDTFRF